MNRKAPRLSRAAKASLAVTGLGSVALGLFANWVAKLPYPEGYDPQNKGEWSQIRQKSEGGAKLPDNRCPALQLPNGLCEEYPWWRQTGLYPVKPYNSPVETIRVKVLSRAAPEAPASLSEEDKAVGSEGRPITVTPPQPAPQVDDSGIKGMVPDGTGIPELPHDVGDVNAYQGKSAPKAKQGPETPPKTPSSQKDSDHDATNPFAIPGIGR